MGANEHDPTAGQGCQREMHCTAVLSGTEEDVVGKVPPARPIVVPVSRLCAHVENKSQRNIHECTLLRMLHRNNLSCACSRPRLWSIVRVHMSSNAGREELSRGAWAIRALGAALTGAVTVSKVILFSPNTRIDGGTGGKRAQITTV